MKKYSFFGCLLIICVSCGKQDPQEQLSHLNGYWQIEKVQISKDSVRQFEFTPNIDYIEITDSTGFRKKVRPQIDGSYKVFGNEEKLTPKIENDSLNLYYSTRYNQWKETVLSADENTLTIKNKDGLIYYYKHYTPISISTNEKK